MTIDLQTCLGIQDLIESNISSGAGSKIAFINEYRNWTYLELSDLIGRVATGLLAIGIRKGDRVAIILKDSIEFAASFFAAIRIGAIAVPISTYQNADDYDRAFAKIHPSILIGHQSNSELTKACWLTRNEVGKVFVDSGSHMGLWGQWIQDSTPKYSPTAVRDDDVAFLLWTSGTTGRSIAVAHRHRDAFVSCRHYANCILKASSADVFLSTSRMFHAYGLGNSVFFPLFAGATSVLISERPTPKTVLTLAERVNATLLFSVPTFFAMMLEVAEKNSTIKVPSLRLSISAAEPLSPNTVLRWKRRFGADILDGVGSTEALHIYLSAREGEVRPGSVGCPVTGYEVDLRYDGMSLSTDSSHETPIGTLWLRGESVASEYWDDVNATSRSMQDGWFNTGDRFYVDDDGYYYFVGRYDSMFRISGKWVSAVEIEALLGEDDAVSDVAVLAYLDEDGFSKLCAFVVLAPEYDDTMDSESKLRELCENRLPLLKRPGKYRFVGTIPRTPTGKTQRFLLKSQTF